MILTAREFRLADGLRLRPRKSLSGRVRGERLSRKRGVSIEFADYREYSDGDDLRHLDWNVLARLDSPVIRTYQDEEDLAVYLLVDTSPSMSFGEPNKRAQAVRIASMLGYLGVLGGDAILPWVIGERDRKVRPLRGRVGFSRLDQWLGNHSESAKRAGLAPGLTQFLASNPRTGLVCLLTDGLDPTFPNLVRSLGSQGHEVWVVQILTDLELDPDLEGDLKLVDAESESVVEVTANSYVLSEYRRRLTAHNQAIADACSRAGGRYTLASADTPLEALLKDPLRRDGWVA